MTTENTDAAARILTKAIRKLTEQLAEADGSIRYEEGKRKGAEDELTAVRETLTPRPVVNIGTPGNWVYEPQGTTLELAQERMAELAEERKRRQYAEEGRRLAGDRMVDLEERIERAVEALDDGREPLSAIVAILRGEA